MLQILMHWTTTTTWKNKSKMLNDGSLYWSEKQVILHIPCVCAIDVAPMKRINWNIRRCLVVSNFLCCWWEEKWSCQQKILVICVQADQPWYHFWGQPLGMFRDGMETIKPCWSEMELKLRYFLKWKQFPLTDVKKYNRISVIFSSA